MPGNGTAHLKSCAKKECRETCRSGSDETASDHIGDDRFDRSAGSAHAACSFRQRTRQTRREATRDSWHDGGPGQVHRSASLRAGISGTVLSDGHGRAIAHGGSKRHGEGGLCALCHHIRGFCVTPGVRLYLHGDCRGAFAGENGLCFARADQRLWTQSPGHRGSRNFSRDARADHPRSV